MEISGQAVPRVISPSKTEQAVMAIFVYIYILTFVSGGFPVVVCALICGGS